MAEYFEPKRIARAVPVENRRVIDSHLHDRVVYEPGGVSAGVAAALVLSAVALTVMVMMLVRDTYQRDIDDQLTRERAAAAQQQPPAQQPPVQQAPATVPSQPPIVVTPQAPPTSQSAPPQSAAAPSTSNVELEAALKSRFAEDSELRSYVIEATVTDGIATLSGEVPSEEVKARAERVAKHVKGVLSVINNIAIRP